MGFARALAPRQLWDEQLLAGGPAAFQGAVGLGGVAQGKLGADAALELAGGDPAAEVAGAGGKILAGRDVVQEGGAGEEEGAESGEPPPVDGRHGALDGPQSALQPRRPTPATPFVEVVRTTPASATLTPPPP